MNQQFLRLLHPDPAYHPVIVEPDVFNSLKEEGLKHGLLMLLYKQLKDHKKDWVPNDHLLRFLEELRPFYLSNVARSMVQEHVEKEVISLLTKEGIPAVVIKGNALAREVYGDVNCRSSCDVDILVRRSDVFRVAEILEDAGYQRGGKDKDLPLSYCVYRLHHAGYVHPKSGLLIEVHWNFGFPFLFRLSSEEIWREGVSIISGKTRLSPEMTIIGLLIHYHSHSFNALKILVDILWALYRYRDAVDWKSFVTRLQKIGLIKTAQITLAQMENLWGDTLDHEAPPCLLGREIGKMGRRKPKLLLSYFCIDSFEDHLHLYKRRAVGRLALDSISAVILSYLKTLLPPAKAIKGLYGDRRNWVLPLNYLRYIRWRTKEWLASW